jgi:hypothetical protein
MLFVAFLALPCAPAQQRPATSAEIVVDAAFAKFWAADSPSAAARAAADIEKTGVSFEEALRRLKAGRTYAAQPAGVVQRKRTSEEGIEYFYAVNVPPNYDPARHYQLRFQLHGGISGRATNQPRGTGEIGALAGGEQIYVLPYAWNDSPWWSDAQVRNLSAILDAVKRTYNVDENRVALAGVSDGATGAYYVAMRETTPYANVLPLNGFLMVLAHYTIDDGHIFPNNLRNKPLFVVNGGRDRLYPTALVEPFTRHLMSSGVTIDYQPQPEGEHNTRWWPGVGPLFETFVATHPRDPHPDQLTWEAADAAHNRAHWLVLDEFGTAPGESADLPDVNVIPRSEPQIFDQTKGAMFGKAKQAGRVDLKRNGNTVTARTKGVTAFTVLLAPDRYDFSQPVTVIANGRQVFRARVKPSVSTLLQWAARDNDRTMLYAAEIKIKLKR